MACFLPTCAQGSSAAVTEIVENGLFGEDSGCSLDLVHMGGASFAGFYPLMCTGLGLRRRAVRRSVGALSS